MFFAFISSELPDKGDGQATSIVDLAHAAVLVCLVYFYFFRNIAAENVIAF